MKFGRILTITLASMLLSTPFAHAQDEDLGELTTRKPARKAAAGEEENLDPSRTGVYLGAGAVYAMQNFSGTGVNTDDSGAFNVRIGYRFIPRLATELHIESYPGFDAGDGAGNDVGDINGWTVGGNARGYILTGKYQPFLLMGVNFLDMETNDSRAADPSKQNDGVAMRFGGGMEIYTFNKVALTADISYLLGLDETDGYDVVAFSLGFIFRP